MAKQTINALLSMAKALHTRQQQLDQLKASCSKRETYRSLGSNPTEQVTEPLYDIKKVDAKLTAINKALFAIDHKVKEANAKTSIEIELDFDGLMSEVE